MTTEFSTRDVILDQNHPPLALITLSSPPGSRLPATLDPACLIELEQHIRAAVARAHRDGVCGIAFIGTDRVFCAGADLTYASMGLGEAQARELAESGQSTFEPLLRSPVPVFAFINGAAFGGGLELALHTDYRIASDSSSGMALPESLLGIVPGWGGSGLVPALLGPDAAIDLMLIRPLTGNRPVSAAEALDLGLIDAIASGKDFESHALTWAQAVLSGTIHIARERHDDESESSVERAARDHEWVAALQRGEEFLNTYVLDQRPAPRALLNLIAASERRISGTIVDPAQGRDEVEALTHLLQSPQFHAARYAFALTHGAGKPQPIDSSMPHIRRVGVAGAGLMASQLATTFAAHLRVPVVMRDLDEARAEAGLAAAHRILDAFVKSQRISAKAASEIGMLLSTTTDVQEFAGCDLVIEAVTEVMEVKRAVFRELESIVAPTTILATNTSALSITDMSAGLTHPDRVLGLHFFNPVDRMPLVEIVQTAHISAEVSAQGNDLVARLGKVAVTCKDRPGFIVNRLLVLLLGRVLYAVEQGADIEDADCALDPLGLPMRPFALLELVGPGVALHVLDTLREELGDQYADSPGLRRLANQTVRLTLAPEVKAGAEDGVGLKYPLRLQVNPEIASAFHPDSAAPPLRRAQIFDDVLVHLTREIAAMLAEGVVASPDEINLAMLTGARWPLHLGGITEYLDYSGYSKRVLGKPFRR